MRGLANQRKLGIGRGALKRQDLFPSIKAGKHIIVITQLKI